MSELVTALKRARGLGSAQHGVGHFIGQRVSAVALLLLSPWALWAGVHLAGQPAGWQGFSAGMRSMTVSLVGMVVPCLA